MRAVFRVDAGVSIGNGHVSRCLTLANEIRHNGGMSLFVCRSHSGSMENAILQQGHQVEMLDLPTSNAEKLSGYGAWLGADQLQDAEESIACIPPEFQDPDWLIVDHYGIDETWETAVRSSVSQIMVIDDIANRTHDCDLLLDQNLGRADADYAALSPPHSKKIIGLKFALLRQEFTNARTVSLARQRDKIERILITMGGVDKENATGLVLKTLMTDPALTTTKFTIVLGSSCPHLEQTANLVKEQHKRAELHINTTEMAKHMSEADLAIGAAGSTSWERCCLGLPSLVAVLADNQRPIAEAIEQVQAAIQIGNPAETNFSNRLRKAIAQLIQEPERLSLMSACSSDLVDGQGAYRTYQVMCQARARSCCQPPSGETYV